MAIDPNLPSESKHSPKRKLTTIGDDLWLRNYCNHGRLASGCNMCGCNNSNVNVPQTTSVHSDTARAVGTSITSTDQPLWCILTPLTPCLLFIIFLSLTLTQYQWRLDGAQYLSLHDQRTYYTQSPHKRSNGPPTLSLIVQFQSQLSLMVCNKLCIHKQNSYLSSEA